MNSKHSALLKYQNIRFLSPKKYPFSLVGVFVKEMGVIKCNNTQCFTRYKLNISAACRNPLSYTYKYICFYIGHFVKLQFIISSTSLGYRVNSFLNRFSCLQVNIHTEGVPYCLRQLKKVCSLIPDAISMISLD